jgi:hypothetical protein
LICCGLLAGIARAETLHLTDGRTVTGDVVSMDDTGIVLKLPDGSYADRIGWAKITQADLKDLQQDPKAAEFVGPFIEESPEKNKPQQIDIKPVPRLVRPKNHSLLGAMFTSSLGLFTLLVLYAGNIYAGYEISIFRAQPAGLVCGVSAVAPVLGPIIFLAMPTQIKKRAEEVHPADQPLEQGIAAAIAAEQAQDVHTGAAAEPEAYAPAAATAATAAAAAKAALPPTKTYARGQFTFNRRFFETQLPAYFAMTRPEAARDMVLTVKAARGTYIAQRISRISANDMHLQVVKGAASEEVVVPFVEVQEVQLKHKDA